MRIRFQVEVDLDPFVFEREGQRYGLSLEKTRDSIIADVENRLSDCARHRDGVTNVSVTMLKGED